MFYYLAIIVIAFSLYLKSLFFGYSYSDDNIWILNHYFILKDFSYLPQFFTQPDFVGHIFYRPILCLSFMVDAHFYGTEPLGYHLTNIVMHVISTGLLFIILNKLHYNKEISFLMSLIFLVHPVLTNAVVWIPGRTDSLLAMPLLSSFILFMEYVEKRKIVYLLGHFLLFIVALLTKELAVILPVICFLYIVFIEKAGSIFTKNKWIIGGWILSVGGWLWVRTLILKHALGNGVSPSLAIKTILSNGSAFLTYLGKIIFPINLSVSPIPVDMSLIYGVIAVIILSSLLIVSKHKRNNYILFGMSWFVVFLVPSFVISYVKYEYRVYLPMIGLLIVFLELELTYWFQKAKLFCVGALTCIIISCAIVSFNYSDSYENGVKYWQNAAKNSPHLALAHRNLGAMYYLANDLDQAQLTYEKALEVNPTEPMVHNNLGLIYARKKMFKEAEREYVLEINNNPRYPNSYYNLGLMRYFENKSNDTVKLWNKTLELDPNFIDAYVNLAKLYASVGQLDKAKFYIHQMQQKGMAVPAGLLEVLK